MPEWLLKAIVAAVSGGLIGGVVTLIQFFVSRKDKENDKTEELRKQLAENTKELKESIEQINEANKKNERDNVRIQLMMLITSFQTSVPEIMKCAQHYFDDLNGDWYMTSIFNNWMIQNKVAKPEWFNEND